MNARALKSKIKKNNFDINEWQIEKGYGHYSIILTTWGLSDNEHQAMTGDQVNKKRNDDNIKIKKMAELFNASQEIGSIKIYK